MRQYVADCVATVLDKESWNTWVYVNMCVTVAIFFYGWLVNASGWYMVLVYAGAATSFLFFCLIEHMWKEAIPEFIENMQP